MKSNKNRTRVITGATTAIFGMALIGLVSCSSGDSSTGQVTTGGSAALQGPIVFVVNTASKSLTSVALKGDFGNTVLNTIDAAKFENGALGDMQFSKGEWFFMNLGAANKVATIDPLTGATPVHEVNLPTGTRPVHIYRDPTDGEVMWSMNDGDTAPLTIGDDLINCATQTGGSVTILHNSHLGPGATPPTVIKTECLLADGHKVAAFSQPTTASPTNPKLAFISSTTAGEVAVIDNDPANLVTYRTLIARIDLCTNAGEALNGQVACDVNANGINTPNTPNKSNPHGIRFSKLTGKIYSIQENYRTIVEIDPNPAVPGQWITKTFDLSVTLYTAFGISPDGRFLVLRGSTPAPAAATKFGVIDLEAAGTPITDITTPEQDGTLPSGLSRGSFKFSPDGKRFYVLTGDDATATKTNRLFAYDSSALPALTLLKEFFLTATGGHSFDVLAQGAGEAKYIAVSNSTDNSLSIINATDNLIKQTVTNVGATPGSILGGVIIYAPGTAATDNQASS